MRKLLQLGLLSVCFTTSPPALAQMPLQTPALRASSGGTRAVSPRRSRRPPPHAAPIPSCSSIA